MPSLIEAWCQLFQTGKAIIQDVSNHFAGTVEWNHFTGTVKWTMEFKKYIKEKKCLKRITIPGGRPLMNIPLHLLEGRGSGYILHCKKDGENFFTVRMFSLVCTISSSISMEATQQQAFICSFMNMRGIHWLHLQWSPAKVAGVIIL